MLEDAPIDAMLIDHELRRGGFNFSFHRVETKQEFLDQLDHHTPDLILSDHGLPSFDGFTALSITRQKLPSIPFIFVTGTTNRDALADSIRRGATDCVFKSQLSSLTPAVQRALHPVPERRFDLGAKVSESISLFAVDNEGRILEWNDEVERIFGRDASHVLGQLLDSFVEPPYSTKNHELTWAKCLRGEVVNFLGCPLTLNARRTDGEVFLVELRLIRNDRPSFPHLTVFVRELGNSRNEKVSHRSTIDQTAGGR